MGYSRKSASTTDRPLPGSSIKGAGSLAPGIYYGKFELREKQLTFIALPHGFHYMEGETAAEAARALAASPSPTTYQVRIKLSPGCGVARTDGGRYYVADSHTKIPRTEQYTDIHEMMQEAAEKKLTFSSPIIVEIKGENNVVLFPL